MLTSLAQLTECTPTHCAEPTVLHSEVERTVDARLGRAGLTKRVDVRVVREQDGDRVGQGCVLEMDAHHFFFVGTFCLFPWYGRFSQERYWNCSLE